MSTAWSAGSEAGQSASAKSPIWLASFSSAISRLPGPGPWPTCGLAPEAAFSLKLDVAVQFPEPMPDLAKLLNVAAVPEPAFTPMMRIGTPMGAP